MSEKAKKVYPPIADLNKYTRFIQLDESGKRTATLRWSISDGSPRISVFVRDSSESKSDIISAFIPPEVLLVLLDGLEEMVTAAPGTKSKVQCHGRYNEELVLYSEIIYGKDDAGIIWMSVIDSRNEKPKIKFELKLWETYVIIGSDGEPISEAEGSAKYVAAMVRGLRGRYLPVMGDFTVYQAGTRGTLESLSGSKAAPAATTASSSTDTSDDFPF